MGAMTLLAQIRNLLIRILTLFSDSLNSVANDIGKLEKQINYYGECTTAAGTVAKTLTVSGFTLSTGSRVTVKFTNANTAANPTLNVNDTGAKAIYAGAQRLTTTALKAGVYVFYYDGSQYKALVTPTQTMTAAGNLDWTANLGTHMTDLNTLAYWNGCYNNTSSNLAYCNKGAFGDMATKTASNYLTTSAASSTYATKATAVTGISVASGILASTINGTTTYNNMTIPYGSCSTAAATAAKVLTLANFKLTTGARITVKFTNTNTASSPTLNVNSTGAKAIYYRGYAVPAAAIQANSTLDLVYNGTQWEVVGTLNWAG